MKISKVIGKILIWMGIVLLAGLSIANMIITGYFDLEYNEYTRFMRDPLYLTIPVLAVLLAIGALITGKKLFSGVKTIYIVGLMALLGFGISLWWAFASKPVAFADRLFVSEAARNLKYGDLSDFLEMGYLFWYPYQIGFVTFLEYVYKVFGDSDQIIRIFNCIAVPFIFFGIYKITLLVAGEDSDRSGRISAVMCCFCLPVMFFVTYVYGNILGLVLSEWAIYFEIKYLKSDRKQWIKYFFLIAATVTFAAILKNNYQIVMIALSAVLLLDAIENRKLLSVALAVGIVIFCILGSKGFYSLTLSRVENPSEGVPKIMFVRMGLSEGFYGPGTYTGDGKITFYECGYDGEAAVKVAIEDIRQRIRTYIDTPGYAVRFFGHKLAITWTEPTYMSMWESNCILDATHYGEVSDTVNNLYYGRLHTVFLFICELLQQFVMIFSLSFFIIRRKKLKAPELLLMVAVIGGALCHLVWETKSQYMIQYYVFLFPYAAIGFKEVSDRVACFVKGKMRSCPDAKEDKLQ